MTIIQLKEDCETVGISFDDIDSVTIKEVIHVYRRKALKIHPDKVEETVKENATKEMQALNASYERLLKYLVEKDKEERDISETGYKEEESEEKLFTEECFKNFNFPTENDGSFTVNIQHAQAEAWQSVLEKIYGEPTVHKSSKGVIGDTFWKFKYSVEESETIITLHIYNKPKKKKASKLLVQSGNKALVCIYVFSELPRIYKKYFHIISN